MVSLLLLKTPEDIRVSPIHQRECVAFIKLTQERNEQKKYKFFFSNNIKNP